MRRRRILALIAVLSGAIAVTSLTSGSVRLMACIPLPGVDIELDQNGRELETERTTASSTDPLSQQGSTATGEASASQKGNAGNQGSSFIRILFPSNRSVVR